MLLSNHFCRRTYPVIFQLIMGVLLLSLVILLGVGFYILFPYRAKYYFVHPDREEQLVPALNAPLVTQFEILRWASQSVIRIYHFGFSDWQARFDEVSSLFTSEGFDHFKNALQLNGLLNNVINKKLQITSVVKGPPVILAEGPLAGRYAWKVNMPVLLTYTSSSETVQRSIIVTMLITRIPTIDSPRGYAIEQFYEESE